MSENDNHEVIPQIEITIKAIESIEILRDSIEVNSEEQEAEEEKKMAQFELPALNIMLKNIQRRLRYQLKHLIRSVWRPWVPNFAKTGRAFEYSKAFGQMRKMQIALIKLPMSGIEYIRALYIQLFKPTPKNN